MLCSVSVAACADNGRVIHYSTGTGFFINREGYVLTNHHVIAKCKQYSVYGKNATLQAQLVAKDEEHDLAVLKTSMQAEGFATFRAPDTPIYNWDSVLVIGYPGMSWQKRKPVVEQAQFIAPKGPRGEDWLIQFSDSVLQGNSGGPLLDEAGNVIGVIQAKSTTRRVNNMTHEMDEVQRADLAISLATAVHFLDESHVPYHRARFNVHLAKAHIENRAEEFVVNIRCRVD